MNIHNVFSKLRNEFNVPVQPVSCLLWKPPLSVSTKIRYIIHNVSTNVHLHRSRTWIIDVCLRLDVLLTPQYPVSSG